MSVVYTNDDMHLFVEQLIGAHGYCRSPVWPTLGRSRGADVALTLNSPGY